MWGLHRTGMRGVCLSCSRKKWGTGKLGGYNAPLCIVPSGPPQLHMGAVGKGKGGVGHLGVPGVAGGSGAPGVYQGWQGAGLHLGFLRMDWAPWMAAATRPARRRPRKMARRAPAEGRLSLPSEGPQPRPRSSEGRGPGRRRSVLRPLILTPARDGTDTGSTIAPGAPSVSRSKQ